MVGLTSANAAAATDEYTSRSTPQSDADEQAGSHILEAAKQVLHEARQWRKACYEAQTDAASSRELLEIAEDDRSFAEAQLAVRR